MIQRLSFGKLTSNQPFSCEDLVQFLLMGIHLIELNHGNQVRSSLFLEMKYLWLVATVASASFAMHSFYLFFHNFDHAVKVHTGVEGARLSKMRGCPTLMLLLEKLHFSFHLRRLPLHLSKARSPA